MSQTHFKYIYGPVYSWRLGLSLGIDPIARAEKICSLDCVYCQLGPTDVLECNRQVFVETQAVLDEVNAFDYSQPMDYLTFSGRGEPTLAKNLGEMIRALKDCRKEKIAVITNSTLLTDPQVRKDLLAADCVLAKLDACDAAVCQAVAGPYKDFRFDKMVESMRIFRQEFSGIFALQIMFVKENKARAKDIAALARTIGADEIELNTPLRPGGSAPLSPDEMIDIKTCFSGLPVTMVYERKRQTVVAFDQEQTQKRHGQYKES